MTAILSLDEVKTNPVTVVEVARKHGTFKAVNGMVAWENSQGTQYDFTDTAQEQIASTLGIPITYYGKMPHDLAVTNLNHWVGKEDKNMALVTRARENSPASVIAVVSPSYMPIDHAVFANIFVQEVSPQMEADDVPWGDVRLQRSYFSDDGTKMVLNFVLPGGTQIGPRVGDLVERGFQVVNDLTRRTIPYVMPYYNRLSCTNGMTTNHAMGAWRWVQRHGPGGYEDEVREWLQTMILDIRSHVWDEHFTQMDHLANTPVEPELSRDLIARLGREFANTSTAEQLVQFREAHLADEDYQHETLWSVLNTFTALARDMDPEPGTALEFVAGRAMQNLHETQYCSVCHRPLRRRDNLAISDLS